MSCVCLFVSDTEAPCGHHNKARIKMQKEVRPFLCKPGNPFKLKWISVKLIKRRCNALVLCSLENNLPVINSSGCGRERSWSPRLLKIPGFVYFQFGLFTSQTQKTHKICIESNFNSIKPEMMRGCKGCFEIRGHSRDDVHLRGALPRGFTPKPALQIPSVSHIYSYM